MGALDYQIALGALDYQVVLDVLRIILPFCAAVAGWFVASRLQDKRERRKEIRALIDETKELINAVYALSLQYYSTKNRSAVNSLSAEIKLKNMLISQYFMVINQAGLDTGGTEEIVSFRKLSTGDVFETSDFKSRRRDTEWHTRFSASTNELIILLDKRYFDTFRLPSMPPKYDLPKANEKTGHSPIGRWF